MVEYLVADSAFSNTYFAVPAYKRFPGENCNNIHVGFNTLLAALCVHSEHTNGICKGSCPWLSHIPIKVSNRALIKRLIKCQSNSHFIQSFCEA
jgi:hypothetical protein